MSDETDSEAARSAQPARKLRRGDVLELELEGLDARGRGLGTSGTTPVAIRHALPGARVRAEVLRRLKGGRAGVEARTTELLRPSPDAVEPRCAHFGTCGGCAFQNLAYPAQLTQLGRGIEVILARAGCLDGVTLEPVLGCDDPWHYRNKMDFTFSNRRWVETDEPQGVDSDFALGLHIPGRFDKVLDIASCAIHFEEADTLLASVRSLAREHALVPWDTLAHTGLLRHLVLRKGVNTGEILVDVVTSEDAGPELAPFVQALVQRHPEITTLVQSVNTRAASVAVGERQHVHTGPGVIRERLLGLEFEVSAGSFFQTNTVQAELLFNMVREEAALQANDIVYDLYCGAGTIGLTLAQDAACILGFESVPSAIRDAENNARTNGITNAEFTLGDVLPELAREVTARPAPSVCVVDPPRAGLHPKVVPALLALAPGRLVYVSCNLAATVRDLPRLIAGGYNLQRVRPVDLFPHTPHVECVLTLERR